MPSCKSWFIVPRNKKRDIALSALEDWCACARFCVATSGKCSRRTRVQRRVNLLSIAARSFSSWQHDMSRAE
jgi:hypothetical protein